jgi:glucose/arabinose dehydrogenase
MTGTRLFLTVSIVITCLMACDGPTTKKSVETEKLSETDTVPVRLELVTTAVETPIEYYVPPDGSHRVYITDVKGKIWILDKDSLLPRPFFDVYDKLSLKEIQEGIGAVAGVAFHPVYSSNGKFYVCYNTASTISGNTCKLVVSEFTNKETDQTCADVSTERRVIEFEGKNICANGSQIAFGPDGYLYLSVGDDAIGDSNYVYKAQDLKYLNGKILRIDVNAAPYAIPADNPFVSLKDARPEIWAYGFRKVWRFTFDPDNRQLFGADVGEVKEEEVDIVTKGGNYGWPIVEGDSIFKNDGVVHPQFITPIHDYVRTVGICIIGGKFYQGSDIPELKDKYVFGDFNGSLFVLVKTESGKWERKILKVANKGEELFLVCGFGSDENNELIVMGLLNTKTGQKGAIYKIVKA